jgi:hypothetical protein
MRANILELSGLIVDSQLNPSLMVLLVLVRIVAEEQPLLVENEVLQLSDRKDDPDAVPAEA